MAWAGDVWYGHPSRRMIVIGVTGTKGKSTTVELLSAVLEAAGKKTAFLSSVHIKVGSTYQKNLTGNTMPGRFTIQQWLRQAADAGCEYALLEVTSQGVVQHRHRFIDFNVAAMTCLHPEHIESHGSFEAYRDAKAKFFRDTARTSRKANKLFFINTDTGANAQYFEQAALHPTGKGNLGEVIFYTREEFISNILNGNVEQLGDWLSSGFNLENAAAVQAIAQRQSLSNQLIVTALKNFKGVSGRMEFIRAPNKPTIVVDYAHTPESLRAVYQHLRSVIASPSSKLIAVLGGTGGGRDTWKRPEMGKIATDLCDEVIFTSEDPYDEDPRKIIQQMTAQATRKNYQIVLDRKEALATAARQAKPGDIIVTTGMGSQSLFYGPKGSKTPWNEATLAAEILTK